MYPFSGSRFTITNSQSNNPESNPNYLAISAGVWYDTCFDDILCLQSQNEGEGVVCSWIEVQSPSTLHQNEANFLISEPAWVESIEQVLFSKHFVWKHQQSQKASTPRSFQTVWCLKPTAVVCRALRIRIYCKLADLIHYC